MGELFPHELGEFLSSYYKKYTKLAETEGRKTQEFPYDRETMSNFAMPPDDLVEFALVCWKAGVISHQDAQDIEKKVREYQGFKKKYGKDKPGFINWIDKQTAKEYEKNRKIIFGK